MAKAQYQIGVLFSQSGSYGVVSRSMFNGAMLAFDEIRASQDDYPFIITPIVADPAGSFEQYGNWSSDLLSKHGVRHVVGCYTSSSRKDVIPLFEKYDALLWYPSHYEGFESSSNVVYTGAAPNQHIIPLIEFLLANMGKRAYCIGSNYIWAWENNRILREALSAAGGTVMAERYTAVGDTDLSKTIASIIDAKPDFIFNTLIGTSAYHFFQGFRTACKERGIDQPAEMPVVSCSLSEPELGEIGALAMDGHISSSVYFSSIDTPANRRFTSAYRERWPDSAASADAEASYVAVKMLAAAIAAAGSDDVDAVRKALSSLTVDAPQGTVSIDGLTNHAFLTPRIGKSNSAGQFEILWEANHPVWPDPYLVKTTPRYAIRNSVPQLRAVK
ncbi:branched-chain amino acid transport system substrate-binding protein [Aminobacter niigataensis]|uniref:Branched-chain amino acid transport system substrate-binding protein n=1 Tax=Aminobacter niigataensis TaxID=83265 RepID=A0ABR6L5G9_9HYPH|nr:transporter substrate-binding domain-containing protein [Aminobacter niigataensis]MBB4652053.1 branched-chain amino acid transport system substrate-binding protein [Aminobacter niigataensis]